MRRAEDRYGEGVCRVFGTFSAVNGACPDSTYTAPEGTVNPWPFTTAALALSTLAALTVFARYRGPGRREVLLVLVGTLLILVMTAFYFVPTLIKLGNHEALTDGQITAMSRTWMQLSVARIASLIALLTFSQVGLIRLVGSGGGRLSER
jgi:hypothetical protein